MPSIDERVDAFPEPWKPNPGEKLVGTVVEVGERVSDYGGTYPVITVLTDDGQEKVAHAFHTVLKNELARLRPAPGDRIAVKYFGRDEARGYEKYRVLVDKPQPAAGPDWGKMAAEAAEELEELPMPPEEEAL